MANRIKSISKYSGTAWGTETPIGADAANVDLATSYTTVTESTATSGATAEAAIGKIHTDTTNLKKAGHGNGTVTNYDNTSSETSKVLTTDCVVAASDDTATAWSKFNRFRRRVSNKFADYLLTSNLKTDVTTTGATSTVYTTSAINQYLANVVGYTDSTAPDAGTIANQLTTLNGNAIKNITRSGTTFTATRIDDTSFTFTQQDAVGLTYKTYASNTITNKSVGGSSVSAATATFTQAGAGDLMVPTNLQIAQASSGGSTYAYISLAGWYSNPSSHTFTVVLTNRSSSSATCNIAIGLSIFS